MFRSSATMWRTLSRGAAVSAAWSGSARRQEDEHEQCGSLHRVIDLRRIIGETAETARGRPPETVVASVPRRHDPPPSKKTRQAREHSPRGVRLLPVSSEERKGGWSNGKTPGLHPGDRGSTPRPVHSVLFGAAID